MTDFMSDEPSAPMVVDRLIGVLSRQTCSGTRLFAGTPNPRAQKPASSSPSQLFALPAKSERNYCFCGATRPSCLKRFSRLASVHCSAIFPFSNLWMSMPV